MTSLEESLSPIKDNIALKKKKIWTMKIWARLLQTEREASAKSFGEGTGKKEWSVAGQSMESQRGRQKPNVGLGSHNNGLGFLSASGRHCRVFSRRGRTFYLICKDSADWGGRGKRESRDIR